MFFLYRLKFVVFSLLIFLSISNTLYSDIYLDKFSYIVFSFFSFFVFINSRSLVLNNYFVYFFVVVVLYLIFLFLFNIDVFDFKFKPVYVFLFYLFFSIFVYLGVKTDPKLYLISLFISTFLFTGFGLFYYFLSNFIGEPIFVETLLGKGRPDVFAAVSYSTTPQVFSTFVVLNLLLFLFLKNYILFFQNKYILYFIVFFDVLAVLLSYNRVWMGFLALFFVFWLFKRKKYFLLFAVFMLASVYVLHNNEFMFQSGTLDSRFVMIFFILDFLNGIDSSFIVLGNLLYDSIFFHLDGRDFDYIEFGPLYVLFYFGIVGFLIFYINIIYLFISFNKNKNYLFSFFYIWYFFFAQLMTHEIYSVSFYIVIFFFVSIGIVLHRRVL